MKVLFTLSYFFPYVSGLSFYAKRLAEGLKKKHQITILTSLYDRSLPPVENRDDIKVIRVPFWFKFGKVLLMPGWLWVGIKQVAKADVVCAHLPQPEALWTVLVAKILRKKTIVIYHCDVDLPPSPLNAFLEKVADFFSFCICLLADRIVNSSLDYASHSRVLPRFLKKLEVVYPPISPDFLLNKAKKSKKPKSSLFKTSKGQYRIGFVGRLSADKGIENLLAAIPFLEKEVGNFEIFLAGPEDAVGETDYVRKTKGLLSLHNDHVTQLGKLTDSQLLEFYQGIDVLVLPSVNSTEAFGMVQVEAMMSGTPVVASDLPGVRVPITLTGMGKVFPAGDSFLLSQSICQVLKNAKNYSRARSKAAREFGYSKTIEAFSNILAKLV